MSGGERGYLVVRVARSALAAIFFTGFAVGSVLLGFLLFPVFLLMGRGEGGRRRMRSCVRGSYRFFVWAARVTGLFRVDVAEDDLSVLSEARGKVVVANHISLIDVIILMSFLPDSTAVAKSAAGRNPFYSRIVASAFIVNDDPERVLASAAELLSSGVDILIFPEGTRTRPGAERRLHRGAAQVALHSGAGVMCVLMSSDPPVLGKGQPWWDVGGRTIRYRLEVRGEIVPQPLRSGEPSHAAAVSLTREIERCLWPDASGGLSKGPACRGTHAEP